jgi:hypothetical protein
MRNRLLLAGLLFTTSMVRAEPLKVASMDLLLTPANGWARVDESEQKADDLVLTTEHLGGPARLELWEEDEPRRTLRGIWTGWRYSVVVEKGGAIIGNSAVTVDGTPGRRLTYRIQGLGDEDQVCVDTLCLRKKQLYIAHCTFAPAQSSAYIAETDQMLRTLKFAAPTRVPTEEKKP